MASERLGGLMSCGARHGRRLLQKWRRRHGHQSALVAKRPMTTGDETGAINERDGYYASACAIWSLCSAFRRLHDLPIAATTRAAVLTAARAFTNRQLVVVVSRGRRCRAVAACELNLCLPRIEERRGASRRRVTQCGLRQFSACTCHSANTFLCIDCVVDAMRVIFDAF